ncbi:ATP-dependent nuclease [Gillisia sp. Hel_I_29]|uniref:ATP-dependent nuclease n=1 Tax=Gillisia sp. Hel_I_29 TaxID=1249975 RepID=UPI0005503380|nr:AAA family ATPase [Gillisia sp. Hel_I_29]
MYLENIKLWNFRKYGSLDPIDFVKPHLDLNFTEGVNVLVGKNDSGKSAIIDAIKIVLKTHSYEWFKIQDDDFHNSTEHLRIELRFEDLDANEAKNFTEWLGWVKDEAGKVSCYLRLILDVRRSIANNKIIPSDVKAGVDPLGYQLTAEARDFLKTTYLRPLRDAQSELVPRKNSRLSQILQGHEAFKGKDLDHILVGFFKDFNNSVEKYFLGKNNKGEDLPHEELKGKELKCEIDNYIKSFYDESKESAFGVRGDRLKNILEKLELSIKDEVNPGLGTLNRLFMASELLHLQKKDWTGIRLGLIEELEAHLHPQAQMQIIEALQKQKDIQLILSTHSPNLGSKIKLENLILCSDNYAFPMGSQYTKLEANEYKFLERFLDATKANLFFANGIIFVEGWSEEILLPAIVQRLKEQGIIKKNLTEAGVSIVNVGNTAFQQYSRIYLRKNESHLIKSPVSIITDVDVRAHREQIILDEEGIPDKQYLKEDEKTVKTASLEKKAEIIKKFTFQNVKTFVAENWTLEYSLFKSPALTKLFQQVLVKIHPQIDTDNIETELGKKLINKGLNKTAIAYELADAIEKHTVLVIPEDDEGIQYLIEAIKYVCND